jgi:hypothetical protein
MPFTSAGAPGYPSLRQAADRLAQATSVISRYPAQKQEREALCDASAALIALADQDLHTGDRAAAEEKLRTAGQILEVALTVGLAVVLPEASIVLSVLALATGKSVLTGEPLSPLSKGLEIANILALGSFGALAKAGRLLRPLVGRAGPVQAWAQKALHTLAEADKVTRGSRAAPTAALGKASDVAIAKRFDDLRRMQPKGRWSARNFGPNWPGTTVPRGFYLEVGGHTYRVHPNATKHMARYLGRNRQAGHEHFPLSPLARAIEEASEIGLRLGENEITVDAWQLGIDIVSHERVVYHALFVP